MIFKNNYLISEKIDSKPKLIRRDRERLGKAHKEDIAVLYIHSQTQGTEVYNRSTTTAKTIL